MLTGPKPTCAFLVLIVIVLELAPVPVFAISVELAKKCNALTAKQFPPREPGNPAAGSAKGSGRAQQEYCSKCVANEGKVDDTTAR